MYHLKISWLKISIVVNLLEFPLRPSTFSLHSFCSAVNYILTPFPLSKDLLDWFTQYGLGSIVAALTEELRAQLAQQPTELSASSASGWPQKPRGFLESHYSLVHVGSQRKLDSDTSEMVQQPQGR